MSLLAPIWLLALGALALPIVLHLISRGRTRRVSVASIRLLVAGDSRKTRRLKPTQLLLLALRCALLAALALALAGPGWPRPVPDAGPDWILVSPSLLVQRASAEPPLSPLEQADLDGLVAGGGELRGVARGFPRLGDGAASMATSDDGDVWSLLREADALAPPGAAFHVFVADRIESLRGSRPTLTRPVRWNPIALSRHNRWIERGGPDGDAGLVVVVGDSDPQRTTFSRQTISRGSATGAGPSSAVAWSDADVLELPPGDALPDDDTTAVRHAVPFTAAVYHAADRAEDAAFVRAALAAAADQALIPLTLLGGELVNGADPGGGTGAPALDLVFRLAADPVPDALFTRVASGGIVVSDGGERHETCAGSIQLPYADEVALARCSPPAEDGDAIAVWTDDSGRPVLDVRPRGSATHYRFHARFHPAWSDLPTHAAFPSWMLELIGRAGAQARRADSSATAGSDLRGAGDLGAPRVQLPESPPRVSSRVPRDLAWLLVALLLLVERRVASRASR